MKPKHALFVSMRCKIMLAVLFMLAVVIAVVVPLSLLLQRGKPPAFTVVASFVASGSVSDYSGTRRSDILNVLSSAAGLGSTAPIGATLDVTAASVNLVGTLPVSSEAVADAAVGALQSALQTPADLTSLFSASGLSGISVEQLTAIGKANAPPPSELDKQLATSDALLLSNLRVEPYDSCRTLARSMRLSPGRSYGEYVSLSPRYNYYSGGGFVGVPEMMMDDAAVGASASTRASGASSASSASAKSSESAADFSSTNVQVEGIDESDIVKNDGRFIYSIGGSQLVIVRAYPSELRAVVSRTALRAGTEGAAAELFAAEEALLDGDMLLILSAAQVSTASRRFAAVISQAWNVSDRASPALVGATTLEGSLVTARLLNGYAYVAVSSEAHLPTSPGPVPLASEVMPVAWTASAADLAQGGGGAQSTAALEDAPPVAICENVTYVPDVQPRSLLTLASVALTAPGRAPGSLISRKTMATGSSWREASVYASFTSIYVATYNSEYVCDGPSSTGVACGTDEWWCIDRRRSLRHASWWSSGSCSYSAATYILAFSIGSDGQLRDRARGAVPGYLLSQWSLDEYDGHLRVAYTRPQGLSLPDGSTTQQTDNAVDVLDTQTLGRVGRVRGLGAGERIYAMRFAGALGYMVTFRQVDPLYTLALSNPTRPAVLGELKIPGDCHALPEGTRGAAALLLKAHEAPPPCC